MEKNPAYVKKYSCKYLGRVTENSFSLIFVQFNSNQNNSKGSNATVHLLELDSVSFNICEAYHLLNTDTSTNSGFKKLLNAVYLVRFQFLSNLFSSISAY